MAASGSRSLRRGSSGRCAFIRADVVQGEPRANFVFYVEDGDALAIVASNAGEDRDPAWWRNLQAQPDTVVDLVGGPREVRARVADPNERAQVWARFVELDPHYAEYQAATSRPIDVVMLERR